MKTNTIPLSVFSPCDRSREIWRQLNELRGLCSDSSWFDCDLNELGRRLKQLRDDLAMHYAHEWGAEGGLHDATIRRSIDSEQLSMFLQEQTHVYEMISDLASDMQQVVHSCDVSPAAFRKAMDRFKMFDKLLISHESRKSMALHRS